MKQIAQNYKSGELTVLDVPAPACRPGGVLVRSLFSLISTGTEMMKVTEAKMSMVGKARARPDQVRKVLDSVAQQGAVATYKKVDEPARLLHPARLLAVRRGRRGRAGRRGVHGRPAGRGAPATSTRCTPSTTGSRSTCASPVPDGVAPEHAAFATVGAIAMHGVRRAEVQLGETACVIGLGPGRPARGPAAGRGRGPGRRPRRGRGALPAGREGGRGRCAPRPTDDGIDRGRAGAGRDHRRARRRPRVPGRGRRRPTGRSRRRRRLARDRARVVDIGKTQLDLPWNAYYEKELDVRFSRSYGPGRYDDRYELEGIDYPAGYVRWTERRNLECFLDLHRPQGRSRSSRSSPASSRWSDAAKVYGDLASGSLTAVGVLLEYPARRRRRASRRDEQPVLPARPTPAPRGRAPGSSCAIGFIGAGNYASSMLLPHLAKLERRPAWRTSRPPGRCRRSTRSGGSASPPRRPTPTRCSRTTSLDAIFIVTRHHTHAELVCRALRDRQGGLRREAARADPRRARPDRRRRRADRQRPAHGRLQPALRAAARRRCKSRFGAAGAAAR